MLRSALLVGLVVIASALAVGTVRAKEPLTFEKIVIAGGGRIDSPIAITEETDLAGTALDSVMPANPQEDFGTAYRVLLDPVGSDEPFAVTYYASRTGDRGYIYRAETVSIGNGTLDPGWTRPSQELENALREYGAVNAEGTAGSGSEFEMWPVVIPVGIVTFVLVILISALLIRKGWRRLPQTA